MIASLVRYIVAALGGWLGLSADGNDKWIEESSGAVMVLVSVVWSLYPKWKAHKANGGNPVIAPALVLAIFVPFMSGCKTLNGTTWLTPQRVEALGALGSYVGISADLRANPSHKDAYVLADASLDKLFAAQKWDVTTAVAILQTLPVKELSTPEAQLGFSGTLLVVDLLGYGAYNAKDQAHVVCLVQGVSRGLKMALSYSANTVTRSPSDAGYLQLKLAEMNTVPRKK